MTAYRLPQIALQQLPQVSPYPIGIEVEEPEIQTPVGRGTPNSDIYSFEFTISNESSWVNTKTFILAEGSRIPFEGAADAELASLLVGTLECLTPSYPMRQALFSSRNQNWLRSILFGTRFTSRRGGSSDVPAIILNRAIQSDVERFWANARAKLLDEVTLDETKGELGLLLNRYGNSGVLALSSQIFNRLPSSEISWAMLQMLAESGDRNTEDARRDVLSAALESRDAGLRYAAAGALGEIGDPKAEEALRSRLAWEKNVSVRRMIEAELRK